MQLQRTPLLVPALLAGAIIVSGDGRGWADEPRSALTPARRIPWTASRITGSPEPPSPYRAVPAFPKLRFGPLVDLVAIPGTEWLLAEELGGKLVAFRNRPDTDATEVALDLAVAVPGFRRAYGIAFHPKFAENRHCYVSYVLDDGPDGTHVSRFTLTSVDPPRFDPASENVVLTWLAGGHNGACLQFGRDGMLYVSTGDGSSPFPPDVRKTGQNLDDLLACILRVDVDRPENGRQYRIPEDNPFVNRPGARGEIWAYGFRNPWKMSFDSRRGDLWVGDVGWEMFEMVYRVEKGGNYGWSVKEGSQPVLGERPPGPTPILPPTVEHSHVEARSITGGYVYHGKRLKELAGAYVYGDYVTGKVWALRHDGTQVVDLKELCTTPIPIVAFGVDHAGELLIVDHLGTLARLEPTPPAAANRQFPTRLSETGLFASTKDHLPSPGVVPYSINAEAWADGTSAERFVALPGDTRLGVYDSENVQVGYLKGAWRFPVDGVLAKTVSMALDPARPETKRRIETQVMHFDGRDWHAYAYVWNDQQDDADLAPSEGATTALELRDSSSPDGRRRQTWRVAARNECILCHTTRAGSIHAFNPAQLNQSRTDGDSATTQLESLTQLGLFEQHPVKAEPLADPYDVSAPLDRRARAYLHLNCGHCHRRGGGGTAAIDLRFELPLAQTNLFGRPTQGTFDIHSARIVAPGDPARSVLFYRMAKLGRGRMPHFGSHEVDERGVRLIGDWIASLGEAPEPPAQIAALRATSSEDDARRHSAELLATTSGALGLLRALDGGGLSDATRRTVLAAALAHSDSTARDLFERFLPEEQRSVLLTNVAKSSEILALAGDAARGRALFFDAAGVSCRNCHRAEGKGGEIGPDLTGIGRRLGRAQVLEGILDPSKSIDPKYVAWLVETTSGQVQTGLLEEQTADGVVLKTADNKRVRFRTDEIETIAPQRKSLMPELLLKDLKPQEAADLIEFLMRTTSP